MRIKVLFCFTVALTISCNGTSSPQALPTPEILTPSPTVTVEAASPTETGIPTAPSATPAPVTPIPTEQVDYQPFSAVVARMVPGPFVLVGGTENGAWLYPEAVVPHLADGEVYQVYRESGLTGSARGKRPVRDDICQAYLVETDSYPFGGRAIGVTGTWDVMPRLVQEIPSDHAAYVDALRAWLEAQNIVEPVVEISQVLRVDIEGDGAEEVLISASHFFEPTGHSVTSGDYSLVIMRKVVENSVVTVPLVADYYTQEVELQFPLTYSGLLVADLNNDGVMEVVVGVERWEGSGVMAYEIDGTNASLVFRVFCGL